MNLLTGKPIADSIFNELKPQVEELKLTQIVPHLAVMLVGDNAVSQKYVETKTRQMEEIGLKITIDHLPVTITTEQMTDKIKTFNHDPAVHGLLVQLPLPKENTKKTNY